MKKRLITIGLTICLIATLVSAIKATPESSSTPEIDTNLSKNSIISFLKEHSQTKRPTSKITVFENQTPNMLEEGDLWEIPFFTEHEGLYVFDITYKALEGVGTPPLLQVLINNDLQYNEAGNIRLSRRYKDINHGREDIYGNEIKPDTKEITEFQTATLSDVTGYWGDLLSFYLPKGENTLTLKMESQSLEIKNITLKNNKELVDYETYKQQHSGNANGEHIKYYEAEDLYAKSDFTIYPINDRTSPSTSPYDAKKKILNTIGAEKWKNTGQYIEWVIDVPADGLYQIALKYRQNINDSMSSYRKIYIDDKILFKEMNTVDFPYNINWSNYVLGGDQPYQFYLSKGKHTLKMEVVMGDLSYILPRAYNSVVELNGAYRSLIMLMGVKPDQYRDYRLFEALPHVIETMEVQAKELKEIENLLLEATGEQSVGTKMLSTLSRQLDDFIKDTDTIQRRLSQYIDNVAALGSWISEAKSQPIELDYIVVYQKGTELKKADTGFFSKMKHEINSFIFTFSSDYQRAIFDDALEVWVQTGRDQAEIISTLALNRFTPKTGININLKLTQGKSQSSMQDQMLMAVAAGQGPNVSIQVPVNDAMNYAFRGQLVGLNDYDKNNSARERFKESALVPLTFDEKLYALPDTQTYPVMFYRKDIIDDLNLEVPKTWEQMTSIISKLQKNNLEVGIPDNFYTTLIYQYGGRFYTDDGRKTTLTQRNEISAFEFWTDLYTKYGLPISYNATYRFRSGEMPLLIADYTMYNELSISAPEIMGLWSIAPLPGVEMENGEINNVSVAGGLCAIMFNKDDSTKHDNAWEFLNWWSSTETHREYASEIEIVLGPSGRYPTANIKAFEAMTWLRSDYEKLKAQGDNIVSLPEVPGGYFLSRHMQNAFRRVINQGDVPGEALLHYSNIIDKEITYKRQDLKLD